MYRTRLIRLLSQPPGEVLDPQRGLSRLVQHETTGTVRKRCCQQGHDSYRVWLATYQPVAFQETGGSFRVVADTVLYEGQRYPLRVIEGVPADGTVIRVDAHLVVSEGMRFENPLDPSQTPFETELWPMKQGRCGCNRT